ncbi:MAG TPA: selenocysteine-specific translation elongation factor, partial [Isosphaeraceae bacterium]|nr:selenocysteine-specific translation elongation factor [Isosphaeraceae bacterium]
MSDGIQDLVLGTAGHIDHGKTALVRALTGIDTDRLPAEKQRGITIDLGFASLQLEGFRLALIDVPGHERFIRNMLAGASGLDLAMLIVAADDSVMPQTREHLEILRLLGLAGGVIVVTKCDLVDPSWIDLVEEDIRSLVKGTFFEGSAIVRTSTMTGQGLDELKRALFDLCASVKQVHDAGVFRHDAGVFRMAIDRSFTVAGHGTVVTGTVVSGSVAVGDELTWHPSGRAVRVRGLQRHDQPAERIGRGARAAINLVGVHHTEILRGQELAAQGYLEPARVVAVEVVASATALRPLRHRGRYKLHLGTAEVSAVLSLLERNESRPGEPELGQLLVAEPIVAVHGQPFVLRQESPPETLGGGRILMPSARRYRRSDRTAIDRLERLRSPDPLDRLRAVLAVRGVDSCTELRLRALTGVDEARLHAAMAALAASGELIELPVGPRRTVRVLAEYAGELEDRVLRALRRLHESHPRQSAIPRTALTATLPDLPSEALIACLIDRLAAQGKVAAGARAVAVAGFEPRLSQAERKLKNELAETIRKGAMSPPDASELAASAGQRSSVVPELLALLRDEQHIVEISANLYLDVEVANELRRRVGERLADGSAITMSELRDLLGT